MAALVQRQREAIFSIDWQTAALQRRDGQALISLPDCEILPGRLLLTAGVGNEALLAQLGQPSHRCSAGPCNR